jgi:regulatory protein
MRKPRETIDTYRLPADVSPVITSIVYQQRDKLRASVFVGGQFAFGINVATIEQFRLRKGDEVTTDLLEKLRIFDDGISAKRIASRYLNARRRSERDVVTKLRGEGYSDEIITPIVASMKEYGLIDDESFARSFVHDKLLSKSASRRELEASLMKKGIAKHTIAVVLQDVADDGTELDRARAAAAKKWESLVRRESDSRKRKQKLYAFLASRGFAGSLIKQVVQTLSTETDQNDEDEYGADN